MLLAPPLLNSPRPSDAIAAPTSLHRSASNDAPSEIGAGNCVGHLQLRVSLFATPNRHMAPSATQLQFPSLAGSCTATSVLGTQPR